MLSHQHKLLSIAATAYINGERHDKVWIVSDDTEDARKVIVKDFIDFCVEQDNKVPVDKQLLKALDKLSSALQRTSWFNYRYIATLSSQIYEIKNAISLSIFGYNSAKYDLQILMKYMTEIVHEVEFS